jgi:hypothetical protein
MAVASVLAFLFMLVVVSAATMAVVWLAGVCEWHLGFPALHTIVAFIGVALVMALLYGVGRISREVHEAMSEQAQLREVHDAVLAHVDDMRELAAGALIEIDPRRRVKRKARAGAVGQADKTSAARGRPSS